MQVLLRTLFDNRSTSELPAFTQSMWNPSTPDLEHCESDRCLFRSDYLNWFCGIRYSPLWFFSAGTRTWQRTKSVLPAAMAGYGTLMASDSQRTMFVAPPFGGDWILALDISPSDPLVFTIRNITLTKESIQDEGSLPDWFWVNSYSTTYDARRQMLLLMVSKMVVSYS